MKDIRNIAIRKDIGEDLDDLLFGLNKKLKSLSKTLIMVYDHLDAVLPSENNVRGKLVSTLLAFMTIKRD